MNVSFILSILVFYPFVGGLLSYLAGRKSGSLRNKIASFVAVSELAFMLYLVAVFGFGTYANHEGAFLDCFIPYFGGLVFGLP